jgi:bifunctional enzyme CysN/CysC
VLAVNKFDLVNFDRAVFERIVGEYATFAAKLGFRTMLPIPLSARFGDNVTQRSGNTPWYRGPCLLEHLEGLVVEEETAAAPFRFPVQWVNRPNLDFRGFSGNGASGAIAKGDPVVVAASGVGSTVARILGPDGDQDGASAGEAVTICLADEVDVARGDVLAPAAERRSGRRWRTNSRRTSCGWTTRRCCRAANTFCVSATTGPRPRSRRSSTAWT